MEKARVWNWEIIWQIRALVCQPAAPPSCPHTTHFLLHSLQLILLTYNNNTAIIIIIFPNCLCWSTRWLFCFLHPLSLVPSLLLMNYCCHINKLGSCKYASLSLHLPLLLFSTVLVCYDAFSCEFHASLALFSLSTKFFTTHADALLEL